MLDEVLSELKTDISKAQEALRRELAKIRTGRANPEILDTIRVEAYGSQMSLKQMASISVPEPRMIIVKPFDRSQIQAIEKAIMQGELGLNPNNDGEIIRVPIPALTEERRKEMVKLARKAGEECKVSIRAARHNAKDMVDELENEGDVGADPADRARKELEEIVKGGTSGVDDIIAKKEKDILEV